ncbi:MAG: tetratricopeptide repeat protein [Bacteroidota bacterium]
MPFHFFSSTLVFLLLWLCPTLWAQSPVDTVNSILQNPSLTDSARLQQLKDLVWANHRNAPEKALLFNDSVVAFSQRMGNIDALNVSHYYYGAIYKHAGYYDKAMSHLQTYAAYRDSTNNQMGVADAYYQMAVVKELSGESDQSLEYYHRALSIYRDLEDPRSISFTLNAMGTIYKRIQQYDKAIGLYEEAMALNKEHEQLSELSYNYNNIGSIHGVQGQYDTALVYFTKYLDLSRVLKADYNIGHALENIARVYQGKKEFVRSLDYFRQSLRLREQLGHKPQWSTTLSSMGKVQMDLKRYSAAIGSLDKSLALAEELGLKPQMQAALEGLSEAYGAKGQYQKALSYHQRFAALKDSMLNEKITQQIAEMDARYESAQKEREIESLSQENQIQHLELEKAYRQNLLIGLGLLAALLIVGLLFYFFRQKQKDNAIIRQALSEKEWLLREIHHRVKNNLQVISSLLDLQSMYIKDEQAQAAIQQGRDRVHSMALIHQNLYQEENLLGVEIQNYFDQLIQRLFHSYNISPQRIQLETAIEDLHLDVDTLIPLGLIVNELVSNALKHAFPDEREGLLKVSLKEEDSSLVLEVADNGVGFTENSAQAVEKSFGYRLIKAFKNRLKASLDIQNYNGSKIRLQIATYQKVA